MLFTVSIVLLSLSGRKFKVILQPFITTSPEVLKMLMSSCDMPVFFCFMPLPFHIKFSKCSAAVRRRDQIFSMSHSLTQYFHVDFLIRIEYTISVNVGISHY